MDEGFTRDRQQNSEASLPAACMASHVRLSLLGHLPALLLLLVAFAAEATHVSPHGREHHRKMASASHAGEQGGEVRTVKALIAVMVSTGLQHLPKSSQLCTRCHRTIVADHPLVMQTYKLT